MSNPNNCQTCDHKKNLDGGWCYMFRDEPNDVCMIHTARNSLLTSWKAYDITKPIKVVTEGKS